MKTRYKNESYLKLIIYFLIAIVCVTIVACGNVGDEMNQNSDNEKGNIIASLEGNNIKYAIENVNKSENGPLEGLNICYLGSSVTYGEMSMHIAIPEYIAKRNGTTYVKEAVSGTTLVQADETDKSYVSRMKRLDKNSKFDLFVCQLSTNDASQDKRLGALDSEDTSTVCGAINEIIRYVAETWNCPLVFYTNAYYESRKYSNMVSALKIIAGKKNICVVDLYTDKEFNSLTEKQRGLYMADAIHPTMAGYSEWWTPRIEECICNYLIKNGEIEIE